MRPAPIFLNVAQVLAIQQRVVREFGGITTIRDHGLLESAVAMPSAQFEGRFLHPNLASMAAAYLFHICRTHPFIDGNKRTAIAATEVFLLLNGRKLVAPDHMIEKLVLEIACGEISKVEAIVFFRKWVVRRKGLYL